MRKFADALPIALFCFALALGFAAYGYLTRQNEWFPTKQIKAAHEAFREARRKAANQLPWFYVRTPQTKPVIATDSAQMAPGMTLLGALGPDDAIVGRLISADGSVLREWDLDWFRTWPNPAHVPATRLPKERPGTHIHGIHLSPNGDLTVIYDPLGMVQVDICNRVKWRLPSLTHHSIFVDEQKHIWTLSVRPHTTENPDAPNYKTPFNEDVILEVSPNGEILRTISTIQLLKQNGLEGLMYAQMSAGRSTRVTEDDAMHFNDVEIFPSTMKPGVFAAGDIMISMRNVNTILVFDPRTLKMKKVFAGRVIRQHDPDFLDGSTITVFDNHSVTDDRRNGSSRIVQLSAVDDERKVLFEGTPAHPFFSDIMGRHQRLPTGGMLVTEATQGRAFELDAEGRMIWQYFNLAGNGLVGLLSDAERIPPSVMTPSMLASLAAECPR